MNRGAGTNYSTGNWIQATFDGPVTIHTVSLGIGGMSQGWSTAELDGATIEYSTNNGDAWQTAMTVAVPVENEIHEHTLSQPITAEAWRVYLAAFNHLGVSFLSFT